MSRATLLHPEIETLETPALRARQEASWQRQWDHVRAHSDFYRTKFSATTGRTVGLEALQELPLTDKEEIKVAQERNPPYGDYVACALDRIVRIHQTSGTTGRALVVGFSASDARMVARLGGRALFAAGLRPGDRVVHCLNYNLWTGGLTDHLCLEETGATVIPFGVGHTERLIETILSLGATAISCTPSYPALLETVLRNSFGKAPRELGLRLGLFGGEAGLDNPEFRSGLEAAWGFGVRNANYGLSEVMSILASQCESTSDLHFHAGDAVFAEILDPATGARLPIVEGTTGELVCTNLAKECQPLVRYRARDVVRITGVERCGCGRMSWRFRVVGRTDDMFNVRGVNVFPTALQGIIAAFAPKVSGHFRVVLEGPGPYDRVRLRVEAGAGVDGEDWPGLAVAIESAVRSQIGAGAAVTMLAFETLPRTAGKTSLIERS